MPTTHLLIKGKVQGVFYRATGKDIAESIGLTGWIRNTQEGDVEAIVTGDIKQIEEFINWCKIGPKKAIVADVIVSNVAEELFRSFLVKR